MAKKSKGLFKTSGKDPGPDKRKKERGLFKTTAEKKRETAKMRRQK